MTASQMTASQMTASQMTGSQTASPATASRWRPPTLAPGVEAHPKSIGPPRSTPKAHRLAHPRGRRPYYPRAPVSHPPRENAPPHLSWAQKATTQRLRQFPRSTHHHGEARHESSRIGEKDSQNTRAYRRGARARRRCRREPHSLPIAPGHRRVRSRDLHSR